MSLRLPDDWQPDQGFPRVSGDEPEAPYLIGRGPSFSPRERG